MALLLSLTIPILEYRPGDQVHKPFCRVFSRSPFCGLGLRTCWPAFSPGSICRVTIRVMSRDTSSEQVVAGVLRNNGQMLLCHRRTDRIGWPNVWDLPGGHIDSGESSAEALVRELEEELGVQINSPRTPPG